MKVIISNFFNSFIKAFGIGLLPLFGAILFIDGTLRFDSTPYKKFFTETEKKEKDNWIDVERDTGFYPPGVDKGWACSVLNSLTFWHLFLLKK